MAALFVVLKTRVFLLTECDVDTEACFHKTGFT